MHLYQYSVMDGNAKSLFIAVPQKHHGYWMDATFSFLAPFCTCARGKGWDKHTWNTFTLQYIYFMHYFLNLNFKFHQNTTHLKFAEP